MVTDIWVNLFSYKFLISTFFFPPLCSLNRWKRCKANGQARRVASLYFQETLLLFTTIQYEGYKNKSYFLLCSMNFQGTISKLCFLNQRIKSWYFCRQMAKHVVILPAYANKGLLQFHCLHLAFKIWPSFYLQSRLFNNEGSWFGCASFSQELRI